MLMAMNGHANLYTTHALLLDWDCPMAKVLKDCGPDSSDLLALNEYHQ